MGFSCHVSGQIDSDAYTSFCCCCCGSVVGYKPDARYSRTIDVDFEIGSETYDYAKLAEQEKLKPMEVELRKLEDLVKDILENMDHLKSREEKMRNTNGKDQGTDRWPLLCCFHDMSNTTSLVGLFPLESTNERVKWFSTMTMCVLVVLGLWQIFYLKRFFRKKRLID